MRPRFISLLIFVFAAVGISLSNAKAQSGLFDFDSAPLYSPLPIDLTVGGITAHISGSPAYYNYSIQKADVLGFTPAGFSGYCVYPSTVYPCDLLISFNRTLTEISILYAPEEYATDSSCTMRITAYSGTTEVATNTHINPNPGTWPSDTLSLSSTQPFDNVVIHYEAPPATGGDYGPIFMADNLQVTPVPVCTAAPSGLVSWWAGNGNAGDMFGSSAGTVQGSVPFVAGKVGQAFSFDGSMANFIEVANSALFNPAGAFSVEGWFYIDPNAAGNIGSISTLISKSNGNSPDGGWMMDFNDRNGDGYFQTVRFVVMAGGYIEARLDNALPGANWYHIAGTFDPAATPQAELFINGVQVGASIGSISGAAANDFSVRIGANHWSESFGLGNDRLEGEADEIHFFNRALTAGEILATYNAGSAGFCIPCTPLPSEVISWWRGDGDATDSGPIGVNGSLVGGASYGVGMVGQAFSFNGSGAYVEIPPNPAYDLTTALTVDAWIKSNGSSSDFAGIVTKGDYTWRLMLYTGGSSTHINFGTTGVSSVDLVGATDVVDGQWHHVAAVYDGTAKYIYVDGNLDASTPAWGAINTDPSMGLEIGANASYPGQRYWNGLIDEVHVVGRALSQLEVQLIYNAGNAGVCVPTPTPTATPTATETPTPTPTATPTATETPTPTPTATPTATETPSPTPTPTPASTPTLQNMPNDIVAEATGPSGAIVNYVYPTAIDDEGNSVPVYWDHASGEMYPLGTTTVTCWATDYDGNTASDTFKITVRDTTAPTIGMMPPQPTARAQKKKVNGQKGAYVSFAPAAFDLVDGLLPATANPPSGSFFPIGTTSVVVTATDSHGNTATRTFTVVVKKK